MMVFRLYDASMPAAVPSVYRMARSVTATNVAYRLFFDDNSTASSLQGWTEADELRSEFQELAQEWHEETDHLSSPPQIAMHRSYQRIIGMGDAAVPLILHDLRDKGGYWFWALDAITNASPVPDSALGNLLAVRDAWIDWGRHRGYVLA